MTRSLAYAGVGSRQTPPEILALMTAIAKRLAGRGYTLRSGAAPGADQAFEAGAEAKEIYLPWKRFQHHASQLIPSKSSYAIAAQFHPNWPACSAAARSLHARNVNQIVGRDADQPDPVRFVVCWTRNASGQGGTGQAIRIARHYGIPVFDLGRETDQVLLAIAAQVQRDEGIAGD